MSDAKRGLVEGERIAQIVEPGQEFPVALPLLWVDVPPDTTTRHRWVDGEVLPPDPEPETAPPSLAGLTDEEIAIVKQAAEILARSDKA